MTKYILWIPGFHSTQQSEERKDWTKAYFKLLEPYDEFSYFKQDQFKIGLDSKENFDQNYQSNWQYYYK